MKVLAYLRFSIICLLGYNFYTLLTLPSGDGIVEKAIRVSNGIAGLLLLTFIVYLLIQGIKELNGSYMTAKWLRYYAILFELIYLVTIVAVFLMNDYYSPTIFFIWISSFIALFILLVRDINLAIKS